MNKHKMDKEDITVVLLVAGGLIIGIALFTAMYLASIVIGGSI